MNEEKGHEELMRDLKELIRRAEEFDFHDFKNTAFATPKMELVRNLQSLIEKVRNGKYDN